MSKSINPEEQHRQQIHRFLEGYDAGTADIVDEVMSEDHRHLDNDDIRGRDIERDMVRRWSVGFSDMHHEIRELVVEGDTAFVSMRFSAVHDGELELLQQLGKPPEIRDILA